MSKNKGVFTPSREQEDLSQLNTVAKTQLVDAINEVANQPAFANANTASPTGNVSTTEKMMGLAVAFTPVKTGRVMLVVAGMALNSSSAGDGTTVTGRYGTGTAPANGVNATGSTFGLPQHFVGSTTAGQQGFTVLGTLTELALNTPIWIDLSLVAVTAGGSSVKDVQVLALEF